MVVAKEMGMSDEDFWDSCPIFFNERMEEFYKMKEEKIKGLII